MIINTSLSIPHSTDTTTIITSKELAVRVFVRVHGDRLEQALAALVVYTAAGVVRAADAGHVPAESIAVALVAF